MGQLVFQATLGGAVNLIGPNIASTVNFTLPSADGSSGQTWITNGSGVLSFGTLGIAGGGTGQTTANAAFNALAPSQTGNSGKYLTTDGTNTSWATNPLGTVTSVAATVPSFLSISGSPITTSGTLAFTLSGTALPTTSGGTGLTSFTSGGVVYASSTSALVTGSALTFDGTTLGVNNGVTGGTSVLLTGTYAGAGTVAFMNFQRVGGAVAGTLGYDDSINSIRFGTTTNHSLVFLQNNAEAMRLTSTSLYTASGINVGIGTSSPTSKLTVAGAISVNTGAANLNALNLISGSSGNRIGLSLGRTAQEAYIGIASTSNSIINGDVAGDLDILTTTGNIRFSTNAGASLQATLDSAGNLGLGVTPSAWSAGKAIEIGLAGSAIWAFGGPNETYFLSNAIWNGGFKYAASGTATQYLQYLGTHRWYNAPSGTAGDAISFTQALTLDASGNLLCGNTSLPTSYGATSGVINTTGGVWTNRGQFSAAGSTTTTFLTLANASNNQSYIVSVRQSGAGGNFVSAFVIAYGASATSIRFAQDNTNAALDMNITTSGLALRLVLASGFGTTTWDWVITRLG